MRVTIEATEAGTYAVTTEAMDAMPDAAMGADMQDMPEDAGMQPAAGEEFATLDEALELVRELLGGETQAMPLIEGEEDFVGGFNAVRGKGL